MENVRSLIQSSRSQIIFLYQKLSPHMPTFSKRKTISLIILIIFVMLFGIRYIANLNETIEEQKVLVKCSAIWCNPSYSSDNRGFPGIHSLKKIITTENSESHSGNSNLLTWVAPTSYSNRNNPNANLVTPTPAPTISGSSNPTPGSSSNCTPNAILINPCRPWFGAVISGNPQAASDPVSQFNYLESIIGRQIDIFHDYHAPGNLPLNSSEIHFAQRANTYIYVNWKPASDWASGGGSNGTVNAQIDQAAASIKAIAPNKIFLTIWHEPENDVSAFDNIAEQTACQNDSNFKGLKGSAGTPAQYIAMWQNVQNHFAADGVTNVVWVMNYMNYPPWQCLQTSLWPGNNLVNWLTFESYSTSNSDTWNNAVNNMYTFLLNNSNSTTNFNSKPWGIAEFNDCVDSQAHVYQFYQQAKAALDANTFPNLRMYMVFASTSGPGAGSGCLTNYSAAGTFDSTEQTYFNQYANDSIFTTSK